MTKITTRKMNRAFFEKVDGKVRRVGFEPAAPRIMIKNPYKNQEPPFILAAPGELVNWATRQRRYRKKMGFK